MKRLIAISMAPLVLLLSLVQFAVASPIPEFEFEAHPGTSYPADVSPLSDVETVMVNPVIDDDRISIVLAIPAGHLNVDQSEMRLVGMVAPVSSAQRLFVYDLYRSYKVPWPRGH